LLLAESPRRLVDSSEIVPEYQCVGVLVAQHALAIGMDDFI
jgi:hypothetical protein